MDKDQDNPVDKSKSLQQNPAVTPASPVQASPPLLQPQSNEMLSNSYGKSASELGLNQSNNKFDFKTLIKPLVTAILLLLLIGGGFFIYKSLTGLGYKTISNGDVNYTVKYNRVAQQLNLSGKVYLQGKDPVTGIPMLLYVGKSVKTKHDCYEGSGGTKIIAKPDIEGEQHNLCYSPALNVYAMNFKHNGNWYILTIFPKDKDSKSKIDEGTVETIASSVKIN